MRLLMGKEDILDRFVWCAGEDEDVVGYSLSHFLGRI